MNHRTLGDSDVEVSTVGFGAWVVGTDWWGDRTRADAAGMVERALEAGITYFDTGDVYGHGRSEEILGDVLAEHRDEVTIGTKIGYDFYDNPQAGHGELPKEMDPDYLRTAFERSLDRLDVEYVDLLQLHNANVAELGPDVLEFLDELRESGRVRAVGLALGPSIGWLAEGDRAIEEGFDAVQTVFNLFEQTPGRHFLDTIDRAATGDEHAATGDDRAATGDGSGDGTGAGARGTGGTSLVARVPHSSGLLNEQVTPDTDLGAGDHRAHRPTEWFETGWEKLDAIRFLERDGERTMAQAAIQWLLYHDAVASVTPTFRSPADIVEWAGAPDTPPLSEEEYERLQALARTNFGVERDDGMHPEDLRSSVDREDLRDANAPLTDH